MLTDLLSALKSSAFEAGDVGFEQICILTEGRMTCFAFLCDCRWRVLLCAPSTEVNCLPTVQILYFYNTTHDSAHTVDFCVAVPGKWVKRKEREP